MISYKIKLNLIIPDTKHYLNFVIGDAIKVYRRPGAKILNKKVKIRYLPMQEGDIKETSSDIKETKKYLGYNPKTNVTEGIKKFIDWYKKYYSI